MKAWAHLILSAVLFCTWLVPQQATASFIPTPSTLMKWAPAVASGEMKAYIQTSFTSPHSFRFVDHTGKVLTEIVTPAMESKAITQSLPSVIGKHLKDSGKFIGKVAAQKFWGFPKESMAFFISLGAVMTYDLITKAAQNPVAYEQLIESQMDPVGQLAFYAFMVANGVASEPFLNMVRNGKINRRFAPFIVYGGMGIGMMASNIVHEIGHWPGLRQCALELFKNSNYENCDKSLKHWGERGGGKGLMNQWTPGLISLVASTFISGLLQSGLVQGKALIAKGSTRLIGIALSKTAWPLSAVVLSAGIQIGFIGIPGAGWAVNGLRVMTPALKFLKLAGQLTVFNGVQFAIDEYITESYSNWDQSGGFTELDKTLLYSLANIKTADWHPMSTEHLYKNLETFGQAMKNWRQMNMTKVLMNQANWEQKFGQLTNMYKTTDQFYTDFVGRMWERQFGRYKDAYKTGEAVSILDRPFPLNGVLVAKVESADDSTTHLEAPHFIEERQKTTIELAFLNVGAAEISKLEEQKMFADLTEGLRSQNVQKVGKSLEQLNCLVRIRASSGCVYKNISSELRNLLSQLRKEIGDPKPIWQKGVGYLIAYSSTPSYKADIDKTIFSKSADWIFTPTLPESMIAAMMFGPDLEKGESSLISNFGFKDIFKAPRIRNDSIAFTPVKQSGSAAAPTSDVFNSGLFDFLNKGNIRSTVLNSGKGSFREWWKKYPETDYMKAWLDYEKTYQENIALLVRKFYSEDTVAQSFNKGPIDNGLFKSIRQEARLYLMILGEMMKDNYILAAGKALSREFFNESTSLINTAKDTKNPSLLSYLKLNSTLDLPFYLRLEKINFLPKLDKGEGRNLIWQDKVMAGFQDVENLLKKIKVQEIRIPTGEIKQMPVSTLNRAELQRVTESTQAYIKEISENLFADQNLLHKEQAQLAQFCLDNLGNLLNEMKTLAEAADAASYVPRHDDQGYTQKRCVGKPSTSGMSGVQRVQAAVEGC